MCLLSLSGLKVLLLKGGIFLCGEKVPQKSITVTVLGVVMLFNTGKYIFSVAKQNNLSALPQVYLQNAGSCYFVLISSPFPKITEKEGIPVVVQQVLKKETDSISSRLLVEKKISNLLILSMGIVNEKSCVNILICFNFTRTGFGLKFRA